MGEISTLYPEDKDRLQRIEDKLDLILARYKIEYVGPKKPNWQKLADAGLKIDAIKALRAQCDLGLKEAKEAVERYQEGNR